MRLVALMSYYDEKPSWLREVILATRLLGVEHLVALDGAYALFPDGSASSPESNHRAIAKACDTAGIDLTHVVPTDVWRGNEVEKRTRLFQLAETVTTDQDWYVIVDADEVVTHADGFREALESTDKDVGTVELWDKKVSGRLESVRLPVMFRAQRGIQVVGSHCTYRCNGVTLWGKYGVEKAPMADFPVRMKHKTKERAPRRYAASMSYYDIRDRAGIEVETCAWCDVPTPRTIPFAWRPETGGITADRAHVCATHRAEKIQESIKQASALGYPLDEGLAGLTQ